VTTVPGLKYDCNPYFYYTPEYVNGTVHFSFDLTIEPESSLFIEGRTSTGGPDYFTGPGMQIDKQTLTIGSAVQMPIPTGHFVHYDVLFGVGDDAKGTWKLTVTLPDGSSRVFDSLPVSNPKFRTLEWIGFFNAAPGNRVYYVDNIKLWNNE